MRQIASGPGHVVVIHVKVPNATTRRAIAELEAGKGKRFASVDDLMAELHADDSPGDGAAAPDDAERNLKPDTR